MYSMCVCCCQSVLMQKRNLGVVASPCFWRRLKACVSPDTTCILVYLLGVMVALTHLLSKALFLARLTPLDGTVAQKILHPQLPLMTGSSHLAHSHVSATVVGLGIAAITKSPPSTCRIRTPDPETPSPRAPSKAPSDSPLLCLTSNGAAKKLDCASLACSQYRRTQRASLEPTKRPLVHVCCRMQLHTPLDGPMKTAHRAWILSSSGLWTGDGGWGCFSLELAARIGADEGRKRGSKTIQ